MKVLIFLLLTTIGFLNLKAQDTIRVVWDDTKYCESFIEGKDTLYELKSMLPDGFYKHFHKNTILINQGLVQDGLRQEVWAYWNANGTLDRTETYVNHQLDGPKKVYYENGMLKEALNYKKGKPVGHQLKMLESGKMWSKVVFDDKGNGKLWEWKQSVVTTGEFKNWIKDGKWTYKSNKDQSLIKQEFYVEGKLRRQ
jgi:antitoxin component YwqK of YwqJK toxin-antitoxin module